MALQTKKIMVYIYINWYLKFNVICLYLNELFTMLGDLSNVLNNYNSPMNYLIVIFNPQLFVGGLMSY